MGPPRAIPPGPPIGHPLAGAGSVNRSAAFVLGWSVVVVETSCIAHVPQAGETVEFMERSELIGTTAHQQPLEARPAFHLILLNQLDRPGVLENGGFAVAVSASFIAIFRIFTYPSAPILTPTYEPRVKVQLLDVVKLGADPPDGSFRALRGIGALELGLGHRSNGQDGCALAEHQRIDGQGNDFACFALTNPPSNALNLHDGSFTTHYAFLNLFAKALVPDPGGGPVRATATAGGGFEWELPCHFDACMPYQMRVRYGPVVARWVAEGELAVARGHFWQLPVVGTVPLDAMLRLTLSGSVHLGAIGSPFGDFSAQLAWVKRNTTGPGVGLFVGVHLGRDDLNIRFEQQLNRFEFGLVIDPAPLEQIGGNR